MAWSFTLDIRVTTEDPELLRAEDAALRALSPTHHPTARHIMSVWPSMSEPEENIKPTRIIMRRASDRMLVPAQYSITQTGDTKVLKNTDWPRGGIVFQSSRRGIATNACLCFSLMSETVGLENRLAFNTVGFSSVSVLELLNKSTSPSDGTRISPVVFKVPIVMRATQNMGGFFLELSLKDCVLDQQPVEVFDTCMQAHVQGPILETHASLGWIHMVEKNEHSGETINPYAMKGLTPVAMHSIVPNCNEIGGVMPVDFFCAIHNFEHYPDPDEETWLLLAKNAFWTRNLTLEEVGRLLDENMDRKHYHPDFEMVISGYFTMLTSTVTAMPYRPDQCYVYDHTKKQVRMVSTDQFNDAYTQEGGDCEDFSKAGKAMSDLLSRLKTSNPLLRQLQRFDACYVTGVGLFDVTSAKLETKHADREQGATTKYVPVKERECGLHAAVMYIPKSTFRKNLAKTLANPSDADQIPLRGQSVIEEHDIPLIESQLGVAIGEGTGKADARMFNTRTYVMAQAKAIGTPDVMEAAERVALAAETRIKHTKQAYSQNAHILCQFGIKPEMFQFAEYHYDYDKIMSGEAVSVSGFYVAPVEFFTDRPLLHGFRHARFGFATQDPTTKKLEKTCLVDAVLADDDRIAIFPQPAISDAVFKCASLQVGQIEPSKFIDHHEDTSGPDVLLTAMAATFDRASPKVDSNYTYVDLYVPNRRVDAHELCAQIPELKKTLLGVKGLHKIEYTNLELNAGYVTGVIRLIIDPLQ
jgi:hypothetical protein